MADAGIEASSQLGTLMKRQIMRVQWWADIRVEQTSPVHESAILRFFVPTETPTAAAILTTVLAGQTR
jgi:hypothetical protein